jgi:DNA-binding NarL/FixJ family response regulator
MTQSTAPPSPSGLLLSEDLIFTSRITGTARDLGFVVKPARNTAALVQLAREHQPNCVLVDLSHPGLRLVELIQDLQAACPVAPRVVAYGSHVDAAGLRRAREAGCAVVLPRSRFVEELPQALPAWLSASDSQPVG